MKSNPMITCRRCKATFPRPNSRGRTPQYCTEECRKVGITISRKDKRLGKLALARDTGAVAVSRSVAERGVEIDRLTRMRQPLRVLEQISLLEQDLEDLKAYAVRQARHQKNGWEAIGGTLHLTAKAAGRRYTEEHLLSRRQGRSLRARTQQPAFRLAVEAGLTAAFAHPAAVESQDQEAGEAEADGGATAEGEAPPGRTAERRDTACLSRALSHLQRASGTTFRTLSTATGVSPSYVSRVLSGHKMPSWPVARAITERCGGNPADVRILWETAQGARPRPPVIRRNDADLIAEALATLRSAMRGLHLAAFSPPPTLVCERVDGPLTPREVTGLLDDHATAASLPDWPVIRGVVGALNADADMVRPLWEHVQVAQDPYWTPEHGPSRSTVPAVFG
ncbi:helix-turn-helix domain-containing protein [Kitasatospora sp. NPDC094028]